MLVRRICLIILLTNAVQMAALGERSDLGGGDPSQWTGQEVYQILNNSPWTKSVKMDFPSKTMDGLGKQNPPGTGNTVSAPPPVAGGMGRRRMGGSRSQGTYSSGSGGGTKDNSKTGKTEVKVQWQSAMVVRLAAAKKESEAADPGSLKPLDEYLVALIELPMTAIGGRAAWGDTDTPSAEDDQRIENNVKSNASIIRSGHPPLTPSKVELNQGRDGRVVIHFAKSDPIESKDKSVEFRLVMGKTELRRKFVLQEMEYRGKLEL